MSVDAVALQSFILSAMLNTYATGQGKVDKVQRPGFIEYFYQEGDLEYRDSYSGYLRSGGQEVIRYQGQPVWVNSYGGGMTEKYMNAEFAQQTFDFLKKAMQAGKTSQGFKPRGIEVLEEGEWKYVCDWQGDVTKFKGEESIFYKGEKVFEHDFLGGLVTSNQ
jgi:hypothetical protein